MKEKKVDFLYFLVGMMLVVLLYTVRTTELIAVGVAYIVAFVGNLIMWLLTKDKDLACCIIFSVLGVVTGVIVGEISNLL